MQLQYILTAVWLTCITCGTSPANPESGKNELRPRQPSTMKIPESVKNIFSGVVGGIAFVYCGQPLDKIKTLMQTSSGEYANALDCLRKTVKKSGFRGLYAGATATLAAEVSSNAIHYSTFQAAKMKFKEAGVPDPLAVLLAGCTAGGLVSVIYTPLDLLKIRLQTQSQGQYKGVLDCAVKLVNTEGPGALMNGLGATLVRTVPQVGAFYLAYDTSMNRAKLDPMLSGGLAGIACWIIALPMDIVKSRIQNSSSGLGLMECAKDVVKKEGVKGLYRGWQPVMLRAAWCNAFCFKALEVTKAMMETHEVESNME